MSWDFKENDKKHHDDYPWEDSVSNSFSGFGDDASSSFGSSFGESGSSSFGSSFGETGSSSLESASKQRVSLLEAFDSRKDDVLDSVIEKASQRLPQNEVPSDNIEKRPTIEKVFDRSASKGGLSERLIQVDLSEHDGSSTTVHSDEKSIRHALQASTELPNNSDLRSKKRSKRELPTLSDWEKFAGDYLGGDEVKIDYAQEFPELTAELDLMNRWLLISSIAFKCIVLGVIGLVGSFVWLLVRTFVESSIGFWHIFGVSIALFIIGIVVGSSQDAHATQMLKSRFLDAVLHRFMELKSYEKDKCTFNDLNTTEEAKRYRELANRMKLGENGPLPRQSNTHLPWTGGVCEDCILGIYNGHNFEFVEYRLFCEHQITLGGINNSERKNVLDPCFQGQVFIFQLRADVRKAKDFALHFKASEAFDDHFWEPLEQAFPAEFECFKDKLLEIHKSFWKYMENICPGRITFTGDFIECRTETVRDPSIPPEMPIIWSLRKSEDQLYVIWQDDYNIFETYQNLDKTLKRLMRDSSMIRVVLERIDGSNVVA